MLNAGSLNSRVAIKYLAAGQDDVGQPVLTWTHLITDTADNSVWANIRHPTGAESSLADKDTSITRASIRIRRRTDVTPAMRVYYGSTVYEIEAVLPDEQDRDRVDLLCEVING